MAWDNTENLLYIHKKPCTCGGDVVMVYEPYEDKKGARICGRVCIDCGTVISMDSQQSFGFYTGKNKKEVWDLDRIDMREFHPIARRIIQEMKGGRYFTPPKNNNHQAGANNNHQLNTYANRQRSNSQANSGQNRNEKTANQQYSQQNHRQYSQQYSHPSSQHYSHQNSPKYSQQNESKSEPKEQRVYRSYIYGVDLNHLLQTKQYQQLINSYEGKLKAGYSMEKAELFWYAYSMGELQRDHDAIKIYTEYVQKYPGDPELYNVYNNRSISYDRLGMEILATQDLKQAIASGHPDSTRLRNTLKAREQASKLEKGKKLYEAAAYKEALAAYEECRSEGIDLQENWFHYAYCQQTLKDYGKALFAYENYLKLYPESANAFLNQAKIYWQNELYEKALEKYQKAWNYYDVASRQKFNIIQTRIEVIRALLRSEEAYHNHNYASAALGYEKFKAHKDLGLYWGSYAFSLYQLERYSEAEFAYSNYMEKYPEINCYGTRGFIRLKLKKYDMALKDLWKGFHLSKEENGKISILKDLALAAKAANHIEQYKKILKELRSRNLADEMDAGKFFMGQKDYLDAIDCFTKVEGMDYNERMLVQCKIMYAVSVSDFENAYQLLKEHNVKIDDNTSEQILSWVTSNKKESELRFILKELKNIDVLMNQDKTKQINKMIKDTDDLFIAM